MTLIAAFRCKNAGGQDEVVLCADRQETCESYRNWVDKLQSGLAGKVDYVAGGAGHATLIEAFQRKLAGVLTYSSARTKERLEEQIQWTLKDFYANEYKQYPASDEDKYFTCLIGLRHIETSETHLWKTEGPIVLEIPTYGLIGHEAPIYEHEAKRLFRSNQTTKAALKLGVHLLKLARLTSNYVDGPTQVTILQSDGIWEEDQRDIEDLEKNLGRLREIFDDMLLSTIDSALSKKAFDDKIDELVMQVRELRKTSLQQAGERLARHWPTYMLQGSPYQIIPSGGSATFGLGPTVVNEVADIPDQVKESMRVAKEMAETKPQSDVQKSEGQP